MGKLWTAGWIALVLAWGAATPLYAQRPRYGANPERTLDVDPPGVNPASDPGRCFKIHYTTSGPEAPAVTDTTPANGVPDYVDRLAEVLVEVHQRELVERGWPPPPSDASQRFDNGGDGRYDVYVQRVAGIGSVVPDSAVAPGSLSWRSFMNFDVNVKARYDELNTGPGDISVLTQRQAIQDVAAHEYFHSIQFGFNGGSGQGLGLGLVMEATANWMNDEAYDELNVNVLCESLGDFTLFRDPSFSMDEIPYGGWFWYRYLSERHGAAVIRDVWDRLAQLPGPSTGPGSAPAMTDAALATRGSSLRAAWGDFAGKLDAKAWFEEGPSWPEVRTLGLAASFATYPVTQTNQAVGHLGRQYVRFDPPSGTASSTLQLTIDGPPARRVNGTVVLETADGRRVDRSISLDSGNDGAVSVSGFSGSGGEPHLRTTSVVLVLDNAELQFDNASFQFGADLLPGPNAGITPWGYDWGHRPPLWQSPDIWVDNDGDGQVNGPGEPSKGRSNALFARVRNLGDQPAQGVRVRFFYTPLGMGLPDDRWAELGATDVDLGPAGIATGDDRKVVSVPWNLSDLSFNHGGLWDASETSAVESVGTFDHFCVRVVMELASDVDTSNNVARSHFANVGTGAGPRAALLVGNPLRTEAEVVALLEPMTLPTGWSVQLTGLSGGNAARLGPGQVRLAGVEVVRGTGIAPPGLSADVSLRVGGERDGGVTVGLSGPSAVARGPGLAPRAVVGASRGGDQPPRRAAAAQPLLLVTPGEGLDFARLDALVTIHDQYLEPARGSWIQRLIAVPRSSDRAALDALPLTYEVLAPDASRGAYLWISRSNEGPAALLAEAAPRVVARRGTTAVLVVVNEGQAGQLAAGLHGPPVRRLDFGRAIRPEWISPPTSEIRRSRLVRPALRARNPAVDALIRQVDPAAMRILLEQLTGLAPIDTPGGPLTIRSRFATRPEMVALTDWLAGRLRTDRLDAVIDKFYSPVHNLELPQIVATLPGTDLPDEIVIATAHLDAVSDTPGADDNASGIAAIVEAARHLAGQKFRRTILFVAFNDEEQGLVGSEDFARRLAELVSEGKQVVGVLNLDMVAFDSDGDRRIQLQTNGSGATTLLADRLAQAATTYGLNLVTVRVADSEESSDYASFWRVGIPAINLGDEYFLTDVDATSPPERGVQPPRGDFTPCYHRPCDRLDDPAFRLDLVADVARLLIAGLADLAEIQ